VAGQETAGVPARGYSWEPFRPGNEVGLRHGAWSPRRVDPLAAEMVEQLLADDDVAYLQAAKWGPAVWAWARCEARIQLVAEYLIDLVGAGRLGDLDDPKVNRPGFDGGTDPTKGWNHVSTEEVS
jgi:hypothetical protein